MKARCSTQWILIMIVLLASTMVPALTSAQEVAQEWELINPEGTIAIKVSKPASRPATLEGKTIVLRWNSKHNGDNYLNRLAELFAEKVPSAKVIKLYEVDTSTIKTSGSNSESARIAKVMKDLKADIVIGSQAD